MRTLPRLLITPIVTAALAEDLGRAGDLTTDAIIPADRAATVRLVSREPGVVAGLPLASADRHHDAVMRNLIGPEGLAAWPRLLRMKGVVPHLYGKAEARKGRKMGHVNRVKPLV